MTDDTPTEDLSNLCATGDPLSFGASNISSSITLTHEDEVLATGADAVELAANVKAALTEAHAQGESEAISRMRSMAEDYMRDAWESKDTSAIVNAGAVWEFVRSNTGEE